MKKLQRTRSEELLGASSTEASDWKAINWQKAQRQVKRLQMRIAKAVREKHYNKAKALQRLLTRSLSAKQLAVKRVTSNRGSRTPGVDGITWKAFKEKMQAVKSLKRRGYNPLPLKRIEIPKKNGKLRPLSIPTMRDRAMQALYLLALEPVAEMQADSHSYGFRPKRCTADAIEQCFIVLSRKASAQWIFEGDIKSCFDNISHTWLLQNVLMDKAMLKKWLTAGFIKEGVHYLIEGGVPQGGIISPALLTITLSGLQSAIKKAVVRRDKVNLVVYADDFIVTGITKEVLERKVKPAVIAFLSERGLEISIEKSKITHIEDGFVFLGFHVRKYKDKLLIKPAKASVKGVLDKLRIVIKAGIAWKTETLIKWINPIIRGWTNYYRQVVASRTFRLIDKEVFGMLWRWAKKRHPRKGAYWVKDKYFRTRGNQRWIFSSTHNHGGNKIILDKFNASEVIIKRHTKIRSRATPYDPAYSSYFKQRASKPIGIPLGQLGIGFR